jgi:hypothetical protein
VIPLRDGAVISGTLMLFEHEASEARRCALNEVSQAILSQSDARARPSDALDPRAVPPARNCALGRGARLAKAQAAITAQ